MQDTLYVYDITNPIGHYNDLYKPMDMGLWPRYRRNPPGTPQKSGKFREKSGKNRKKKGKKKGTFFGIFRNSPAVLGLHSSRKIHLLKEPHLSNFCSRGLFWGFFGHFLEIFKKNL